MGSRSAKEFVEVYAAEMEGLEPDLERVVTDVSGLDAAGMVEALADPWFTEPGRQPVALQMMCDWMAPEGSIYFDAIFGDHHGQHAIRNWLIPAMAGIDFIEFVPTAAPALFDDGVGGSSLDEWQMFANLGDARLPLSRGVSVRRYRDGWITWACDVYDTGPFRVPPPPDVDIEAEPLPDWPRTSWSPDPNEPEAAVGSIDVDAIADGFHPTESVYHDPRIGELRGREAVREWLADLTGKAGDVVYEPLGPRLDDGATSVQEWQQMAVQPDGSRIFMTRGTSVRRRTDGLVTYAADYLDTASLSDPDITAAAQEAGSTLTAEDIARHLG
ncbi:MAG: nuclear transport factor 2 family protein [Ilumatobacteraceae bacterium]